MDKQKAVVKSADNQVGLGDIQQFSVVILLAVGVYLFSYGSADATMIAEVLCSAVTLVMLDIARALATLAVIGLGIAALLGKATWGQGLMIVAGIGLIFGAGSLALTLTTGPIALASTVAAIAVSPVSAATAAVSLAGCGAFSGAIGALIPSR